MRQNFVEYFKRVKQLFTSHSEVRIGLAQEISSCADVKELADMAYVMHKSSEMLDMMRKQCDEMEIIAEKIACLIYTQLNMEGPIRTDHCTATADVKMIASVPKRKTDPEGFYALMDFLKIPRDMTDGEKEVVRCHWPGLVAHLSELMAEGKPLPPGIDPSKTYPEYRLKLLSRKGVDA